MKEAEAAGHGWTKMNNVQRVSIRPGPRSWRGPCGMLELGGTGLCRLLTSPGATGRVGRTVTPRPVPPTPSKALVGSEAWEGTRPGGLGANFRRSLQKAFCRDATLRTPPACGVCLGLAESLRGGTAKLRRGRWAAGYYGASVWGVNVAGQALEKPQAFGRSRVRNTACYSCLSFLAFSSRPHEGKGRTGRASSSCAQQMNKLKTAKGVGTKEGCSQHALLAGTLVCMPVG